MKILVMSCQAQQHDETIFSSGASRITGPDKLIELVPLIQLAVYMFIN